MKIKKTWVYKLTHTPLDKLTNIEKVIAISTLPLVVVYLIAKKFIIKPTKWIINTFIKKYSEQKKELFK